MRRPQPIAATRIAATLPDFRDARGVSSVSYRVLAASVACCRKTAIRSIKKLVDLGRGEAAASTYAL